MSSFSPRDRAREADPQWVGWRTERLRCVGFSSGAARRLARDARVDLHAILDLVDRGCPPHLAERILAPLDEALRRQPVISIGCSGDQTQGKTAS